MEKFSESLRKVSPYMNIGGIFVGCMVIGVFGGRWLDEKWGTEPWMLLTGSLVGMASGFYHFFKTVLRLDGKQDGKKNDDDARH